MIEPTQKDALGALQDLQTDIPAPLLSATQSQIWQEEGVAFLAIVRERTSINFFWATDLPSVNFRLLKMIDIL